MQQNGFQKKKKKILGRTSMTESLLGEVTGFRFVIFLQRDFIADRFLEYHEFFFRISWLWFPQFGNFPRERIFVSSQQ